MTYWVFIHLFSPLQKLMFQICHYSRTLSLDQLIGSFTWASVRSAQLRLDEAEERAGLTVGHLHPDYRRGVADGNPSSRGQIRRRLQSVVQRPGRPKDHRLIAYGPGADRRDGERRIDQ